MKRYQIFAFNNGTALGGRSDVIGEGNDGNEIRETLKLIPDVWKGKSSMQILDLEGRRWLSLGEVRNIQETLW